DGQCLGREELRTHEGLERTAHHEESHQHRECEPRIAAFDLGAPERVVEEPRAIVQVDIRFTQPRAIPGGFIDLDLRRGIDPAAQQIGPDTVLECADLRVIVLDELYDPKHPDCQRPFDDAGELGGDEGPGDCEGESCHRWARSSQEETLHYDECYSS